MFTSRIITSLQTGLLLMLSLSLQPSVADNLPDYYPAKFQQFGTIDSIDRNKRTITVSDRKYFMGRNLAVHSLRTQQDSELSLRKGVTIGLNYYTNEKGQQYMTEAWLLPADLKESANRLPIPVRIE